MPTALNNRSQENMLCRIVTALSMACTPLAVLGQATAGNYPDKPIRLIVSSMPAGAADVLGRLVGQKLSESFGKQIVIDNRAGASGNIGVEIAAKATPDGHTLLVAQTQTLAVNPNLYKNLAFDPLRDFAPVAMIGSVVFLLVATPSLAVNTLPELIKLARAKPGRLTFGSASPGAVSHLAGEKFKNMAGIDIVHVPYKGASQAVIDLIGGQISLMFVGGPAAMAQIKDGKLKLIAVAGAERAPAFPGVPTMGEAGMPGFEASVWFGVVAPARTPQGIVMRLNQEINKSLGLPDVRKRLASQGVNPIIMTPPQFGAYIGSEIMTWAKVVKDSGARAE